MFTALFPTHKPSVWSLEKPWCHDKMQIHVPHESYKNLSVHNLLIPYWNNTYRHRIEQGNLYMYKSTHVCTGCNSGKRGKETIMANAWIATL